ncbi:MAG: hypothetical protein QM772_08460 [Ottowia sp.]|uniref:hypothetical protein n=1 Tax=Ottowia sp. TaxID=1898956 RepID=UPI0039E583A4
MNQRNVAASVRARLLNKACAEKFDFNLLLARMPGRPAVRDWKRSASQCVEWSVRKLLAFFGRKCLP